MVQMTFVHLIARLPNVPESPSCLQERQHGPVGSSGLFLFINKALLCSSNLDYMTIVSKALRRFFFPWLYIVPSKDGVHLLICLLKVEKVPHLSTNISCSFVPAYLGPQDGGL